MGGARFQDEIPPDHLIYPRRLARTPRPESNGTKDHPRSARRTPSFQQFPREILVTGSPIIVRRPDARTSTSRTSSRPPPGSLASSPHFVPAADPRIPRPGGETVAKVAGCRRPDRSSDTSETRSPSRSPYVPPSPERGPDLIALEIAVFRIPSLDRKESGSLLRIPEPIASKGEERGERVRGASLGFHRTYPRRTGAKV